MIFWPRRFFPLSAVVVIFGRVLTGMTLFYNFRQNIFQVQMWARQDPNRDDFSNTPGSLGTGFQSRAHRAHVSSDRRSPTDSASSCRLRE